MKIMIIDVDTFATIANRLDDISPTVHVDNGMGKSKFHLNLLIF